MPSVPTGCEPFHWLLEQRWYDKEIAQKADTPFTLLYTKASPFELGYMALERIARLPARPEPAWSMPTITVERRKNIPPLITTKEVFWWLRLRGSAGIQKRNTWSGAAGMMENEREDYRYAGLYATRLFIAETNPNCPHQWIPIHWNEDNHLSGEKQFDYVNHATARYRLKWNRPFTGYLKRTGVYLPSNFKKGKLPEQKHLPMKLPSSSP